MAPIQITVVNHGEKYPLTISDRAQEATPILASIPEGSHLPSTSTRALRSVLRYLDGDERLDFLRAYGVFQRQLAKSWVLAGQLGLPFLQNALLYHYREIYLHAKWKRTMFEVEDRAFEFLHHQDGSEKVEGFLIMFNVGLCHDRKQVELQFQDCRAGLATYASRVWLQVKEFRHLDPIEHNMTQFLVEVPSDGSKFQLPLQEYGSIEVNTPEPRPEPTSVNPVPPRAPIPIPTAPADSPGNIPGLPQVNTPVPTAPADGPVNIPGLSTSPINDDIAVKPEVIMESIKGSLMLHMIGIIHPGVTMDPARANQCSI